MQYTPRERLISSFNYTSWLRVRSDSTYLVIPPDRAVDSYKCFQYMRISANIALDLAPLDPGHPDKFWAVVLGYGEADISVVPEALKEDAEVHCLSDGFVVCHPGGQLLTMPFEKEGYIVQLFCPCLADKNIPGPESVD